MKRYDLQANYPQLVRRLRDLGSEGLGAAKIAERLNAEGFRPPKRAERFHAGMVRDSCGTSTWPAASRTAAMRAWAATNTARGAWRGSWMSRAIRFAVGYEPAG